MIGRHGLVLGHGALSDDQLLAQRAHEIAELVSQLAVGVFTQTVALAEVKLADDDESWKMSSASGAEAEMKAGAAWQRAEAAAWAAVTAMLAGEAETVKRAESLAKRFPEPKP